MAENVNVSELVTLFKEAWEASDCSGREGHRTEDAIAAVLEHLLLMDGDVVQGEQFHYQGLTVWLGDGLPVSITDEMTAEDIRDLVPAPLQRQVLLARLDFVRWALTEHSVVLEGLAKSLDGLADRVQAGVLKGAKAGVEAGQGTPGGEG